MKIYRGMNLEDSLVILNKLRDLGQEWCLDGRNGFYGERIKEAFNGSTGASLDTQRVDWIEGFFLHAVLTKGGEEHTFHTKPGELRKCLDLAREPINGC